MAETSLQENACVESDFLNLKKAKCEVFNGFNGMFMGLYKNRAAYFKHYRRSFSLK